MKTYFCPILWSLLFFQLNSQTLEEKTEVDFVKSIVFKSEHNNLQFPLVKLNESFRLEFDDLSNQDANYYYKIKHCNKDWTESDLLKNDYLAGFDNQRIENAKTSFGTLQRYTHFSLFLPNQKTQLKISGNYLIEIYDDYDELVFSRKFLVYEDQAELEVQITNTQDFSKFKTHQNLQFSFTTKGFKVRNPNSDLSVLLIQNNQWDSSFFSPPPQYVNNNQFEYRYDTQTQFEGGNEYLNFDTSDIRLANQKISFVEKKEFFHHYLYTDANRIGLPYTFNPDINGDFVINTIQGNDVNTEADYSIVYFSLAKQYGLDESEIYVYGKFNNYELKEENRLIYNPNLELFEGILLLKQGFYNYKYVVISEGNLKKNAISDTHFNTENSYLALVYHRGIGQRYDALIGWGKAESFQHNN